MSVELYIEDERVDLPDNFRVQVNYQIFSFQKLGGRSGYFSTPLTLPLTGRNKSAMKSIEEINNSSDKPFRLNKARLFSNGVDVKVESCIIDGTNNGYRIRLFGGSTDFFALIDKKKAADLDDSSIEHQWTIANVAASRTNTSGYIYPLINYFIQPFSLLNNTDRRIDVRAMFPSIFYRWAVNQIFTDAGYTLTNEIQEKRPLLFTPEKRGYLKDISKYTSIATSASVQTFVPLTQSPLRYPTFVENPLNELQTILGEELFTAAFNRNITVRVTINVTTVPIIGFLLDGTAPQSYLIDTLGEHTVDFVGGEIVLPIAVVNTSSTESVVIDSVRVEFITSNNELLFRGLSQPATFLGERTQSQILSDYMKLTGALLTVDERTKTAKLFSISTIKRNKSKAVNWTNKVDYSVEPKITFLGRKEFFYTDDETVVKPTGTDGNISESKDNLRKEEIRVSHAATTDIVQLKDINIPVVSSIEYDGTAFAYDKGKTTARVLYLKSIDAADLAEQSNLRYTDGTTNVDVSTDFPTAYFINEAEAHNLGFDNSILSDYYEDAQEILTQPKVSEQSIRLNEVDINQLDLAIPVYLDEENAYYYINAIGGYEVGKATSCVVNLTKI